MQSECKKITLNRYHVWCVINQKGVVNGAAESLADMRDVWTTYTPDTKQLRLEEEANIC
jgi:hypothetical protein